MVMPAPLRGAGTDREAPGVLTEKAEPRPLPLQPPTELPRDTVGYRVKRKLLDPPLHTEQLDHERLGKATALAVFAPRNLSASAYPTAEIIRVPAPPAWLAAFA